MSEELDREYTYMHLTRILQALSKFAVINCHSGADLLRRLQAVESGVIYLYCHGGKITLEGTNSSVRFLGIGKNDRFTPDEILNHLGCVEAELYWRKSNPLVFINGCYTAELTPDALVNFVDTFAGLYSSGVIGTEITVHQLIANEAGSVFLQKFQSGESVGEALRGMRNHLLQKGNVLGLAYSAYCLSSLRLEVDPSNSR
jgi:hypothetical protein